MTLNCIAVDDEPLALGLVSLFIEQTPFLNLTGKYSSAVEALKILHTETVDLIFLDIQMPDLNGIELARVLDGRAGRKPRIIFTTAYNQFALEGYKVDALDYLLKPFNYEEFLKAANKALAYQQLIIQAEAIPVNAEPREENRYVFLRVEYQLIKINLDDIIYIEGLKDYVKVWLTGKDKALLSLTSLKALEDKLPPRRFMRVHRSFIVSLDKIHSVARNAIQIGGVYIAIGDQYKDTFNNFLNQ